MPIFSMGHLKTYVKKDDSKPLTNQLIRNEGLQDLARAGQVGHLQGIL
jgi:hypothetical protein